MPDCGRKSAFVGLRYFVSTVENMTLAGDRMKEIYDLVSDDMQVVIFTADCNRDLYMTSN